MSLNALTIDVEDYFHPHAFSAAYDPASWESLKSGVERNTNTILDILDSSSVAGGDLQGAARDRRVLGQVVLELVVAPAGRQPVAGAGADHGLPFRGVERGAVELVGPCGRRALLGGGGVYGPFFGTLAFMGIKDFVSTFMTRWELAVGILTIIVCFKFKGGVWGTIQTLGDKIKTKMGKQGGAVSTEAPK